MAKRGFIPPLLAEIEDYVRVKNLAVDPKFFLEFFTEGEPQWVDSRGNPVRNWKQKILTWHRQKIEKDGAHRCRHSCCRKPGVYPAGRDRDGHPLFDCIDHKPIEQPVLPPSITKGLLRDVNSILENEADLRRRRNQAVQLQAEALRRGK